MASIDAFPSSLEYLVTESQVNAEGIHQWPFQPGFPVDVVHHTLSGHHPFRMNRHDYFELIYLRDGELVCQVQDSFVTGSAGDLFVMTSPKFHRVTERSSPRVAVESLFFHPELMQSPAAGDCESKYLTRLQAQDASFQHIVPAASRLPEEIAGLMGRIYRKLPAPTDRERVCVKTCVKMVLVLLMEHAASTQAPAAGSARERDADQFKPLFDTIEKHYRSPISSAEAAEVVKMSLSSFRWTFRRVTGQSFVPYLNHFRIAKAQQLLAESEIPIADIALEVGFCDQSYFGLVFRKSTSMTPRRYRQQARERGQGSTVPAALLHGRPRTPDYRRYA